MNYIKRFRIVSILTYFLSLFIPIFSGSDYTGAAGLLLGIFYIDIWDPYYTLPWIANILYFTNLIIYLKQLKIGVILSVLTISFGSFTLGIKEVLINEGGLTVPVSVGVGFSFWMFSFLLLFAGQLFYIGKSKH